MESKGYVTASAVIAETPAMPKVNSGEPLSKTPEKLGPSGDPKKYIKPTAPIAAIEIPAIFIRSAPKLSVRD